MDFCLDVFTSYDLCSIPIPIEGIANKLSISKHIELRGLNNNLEPDNPILSIIYLENAVMLQDPLHAVIAKNYFLLSEICVDKNQLIVFDHKSYALTLDYLDYDGKDLIKIFPDLENLCERWGLELKILLAIAKYNIPIFSLS